MREVDKKYAYNKGLYTRKALRGDAGILGRSLGNPVVGPLYFKSIYNKDTYNHFEGFDKDEVGRKTVEGHAVRL